MYLSWIVIPSLAKGLIILRYEAATGLGLETLFRSLGVGQVTHGRTLVISVMDTFTILEQGSTVIYLGLPSSRYFPHGMVQRARRCPGEVLG